MPRLHQIDLDYLGQPGAIASYAIETEDGIALIESGPASTLGALEAGLAGIGATFADVRHVLLTHIHFDHAGAAGHLAAAGARVHAHAFGARHLIDPSKLIASATRIYGDDMDRMWGTILPVPEARMQAVEDGDTLAFGGLDIRAIETPGHARHHHAFAVELDDERICFTGDAAAAVSMDAPMFISLPAPPPEFDVDAWLATIERLRCERFDALYPTHFGRIDDVDGQLDRAAAAVRMHAERIKAWMDEGRDDAWIREAYGRWFIELADAAGLPEARRGFYAKGSVVNMNVTGIIRYWTKRAEAAIGAAPTA